MTMQTDVKASRITATGSFQNEGGTADIGRCRVKAIHFKGTGTVALADGSGGTVRLTLDGNTNSDTNTVLIPGEGILFTTGVHGTLTTVTAATIFYG